MIKKTPFANRYTIGIFGKRNVGKSSLINALTGQNTALASPIAGTTTDPVYKAMELLPIGPVVFVDTPGIDDEGELGSMRVEKAYEVLRKCNFVILVADAANPDGVKGFIYEIRKMKVPFILVLNKNDISLLSEETRKNLQDEVGVPVVLASAAEGLGIDDIKKAIIKNTDLGDADISLTGDLVDEGDIAVLVTPIDAGAPKGRMILPQQQVLRDILDNGGTAFVTQESGISKVLHSLKKPPKIVITDSQAFLPVSKSIPADMPLTSFSILFARQKGNLEELVRGVRRIKLLNDGDRVLVAEGCSHHRQGDDIGTVKIPRWVREISGSNVEFEYSSGSTFPRELSEYSLVIHCGACMLNRKEMLFRINTAQDEGVFITNYGMLIAYATGILDRALAPLML